MSILKKQEIKLRNLWKKNLQSKGVKFPTGSKLTELICLFCHMPNPLTQDEIDNWHKIHKKKYNRQARHLADAGWYIKSGNSRFTRGVIDEKFKRDQLSLHSIEIANPKWSRANQKRVNKLSNLEWKDILKKFKQRGCAVCGRQMEHYDKGHLDRSKPYQSDNIVPMCSSCNNWGQAHNLDFKMSADLVCRPIIQSKS